MLKLEGWFEYENWAYPSANMIFDKNTRQATTGSQSLGFVLLFSWLVPVNNIISSLAGIFIYKTILGMIQWEIHQPILNYFWGETGGW